MQNANVNANARCVMCLDDLCGELIGLGRWARMRAVWKDAASPADVPLLAGTSNPSNVGPDVSQRSEAGASASASASASGPRCAFYPWICNSVHPWQTTLDLYIDRVTSHAWLVHLLPSQASEGSTAKQRERHCSRDRETGRHQRRRKCKQRSGSGRGWRDGGRPGGLIQSLP